MILADRAPAASTAHDDLARLVAACVGAPVALASFVKPDRQVFEGAYGLPEPWASRRWTPLSHSFCQHVVAADAPLVVEDARLDPLLRDNLAVSEIGVVAYLGAPVRDPDGRPVAALCAIDVAPRRWRPADLESLQALARAVEDRLRVEAALKEKDAALARLGELNAALAQSREDIADILARRQAFFAFLSHELRTPLNGVLGGLALMEAQSDDPDRRARCSAMVRASAEALAELAQELIDLGAAVDGREVAPMERFSPCETAQGAADALSVALDMAPGAIPVRSVGAPREWVGDARGVSSALRRLLERAMAASPCRRAGVEIGTEEDALVFRVASEGRGCRDGFASPIVGPSPEDGGHPSLISRGSKLGVAIARETARRMGGFLTMEGGGPSTIYVLRLPSQHGRAAQAAEEPAAVVLAAIRAAPIRRSPGIATPFEGPGLNDALPPSRRAAGERA